MRIKQIAHSAVAITAVLVQLSVSSCDSGSSTPCVDAGYDLTGVWQLVGTYASASSECEEEFGDPYDLIIDVFQDGTSFEVGYAGQIISGTVCGDTARYSYNFPGEESGHGVFTVVDESLMTGTVNYTQDDGCSASVEVSATPFAPLITDDENNTAVVINERSDRGVFVVMRPRGHGVGGLIPIGYVEPGGVVVFPLPPGTWDVFTTYSDEGATQFDYLGEMTDPGAWATQSGSGRYKGRFLDSSE